MKKIIVNGKAGIQIVEEAEPTCGIGQLKIKNAISLVSTGTEMHYINKSITDNTNLSLGYCSTGYVVEIGEGVEGFSIGQRVTAMGWNYATHSEVISVPYKLCVGIPDTLTFEKAVFANLNATGLHAIDRAEILDVDNVLVVGSGLVGQLLARSIQLITPQVTIMDYCAEKLKSSADLGIDTFHLKEKEYSLEKYYQKFTKVILCINKNVSNDTFSEYIKVLNSYGNGIHRSSIIIVGRFNAGVYFSVEMGNIDIKYAARCGEGYKNDDYVHGLEQIQPIKGEHTVDQNLSRSVNMISSSQLKVDDLIKDTFHFSDANEAYNSIRNSKTKLSVLLKYK